MSVNLKEKPRNVIPRLRKFSDTVISGQLSSVKKESAKKEFTDKRDESEWLKKISDWKDNKTLSYACDLIGSSIFFGESNHPEVINAANYVVSNSDIASMAALNFSNSILKKEDTGIINRDSFLASNHILYRNIKECKKILSKDARNSIVWVDVAISYLELGQSEKAKRAIEMATHFSPNNRFVLRSAARLYIHTGDNDKAQWLLRHSDNVKIDPWLLSAELAVSASMGKTSKLLKSASLMLKSKTVTDFSISELSSELGTAELAHGTTKKLKKYFSRALLSPTENSIAQAVWVSDKEKIKIYEPSMVSEMEEAYEARAYNLHYVQGDIEGALVNSRRWLTDQPFSSRPAIMLSFVSPLATNTYEESIEVCKHGLTANESDILLLNNLAFALASSGKVDDAEKEFMKIGKIDRDDSISSTLSATAGLLMFRKGCLDEGRALYLNSIGQSKKQGRHPSAAMAAFFLAREEVRCGTDNIKQSISAARELLEGNDSPELKIFSVKLTELEENYLKKQ